MRLKSELYEKEQNEMRDYSDNEQRRTNYIRACLKTLKNA